MLKKIKTYLNEIIELDDEKGMFGLFPGDRVFLNTRMRKATIVGVGVWPVGSDKERLWVHVDGDSGATFIDGEADFEKN